MLGLLAEVGGCVVCELDVLDRLVLELGGLDRLVLGHFVRGFVSGLGLVVEVFVVGLDVLGLLTEVGG